MTCNLWHLAFHDACLDGLSSVAHWQIHKFDVQNVHAGAQPVPQMPGGLVVSAAHLTAALACAKKRAATAIGAPAIPDVRYASSAVHRRADPIAHCWPPAAGLHPATLLPHALHRCTRCCASTMPQVPSQAQLSHVI